MTLRTIIDFMSTGQWEKVVIDIAGRPVKRIYIMTYCTVCGIIRTDVIRTGRAVVVFLVATKTIGADRIKSQLRFGLVTLKTLGHMMCAFERK